MRPDYVRDFEKPKGTAIKKIGRYWYLCKVSYKYDSDKKRTQTIWGDYLGRIDEDGFHPKKVNAAGAVEAVAEVGATTWCWENTAWMRERLKKYFPKMWKRLYVIAVLEAIANDSLHLLDIRYRDSAISQALPGLSMTAASLSRMMKSLGAKRDDMKAFMEEDLSEDMDYLLVDGHRVLSAAEDMETARIGYDTKKRYKPQINLMYMFSLSKDGCGKPVYYQQFNGNTLDISALPEMLTSLKVLPERCIVTGDKGCSSEKACSLIAANGLYYCMPLKRNNRFIKGKIPAVGHYEHIFMYHERPIECVCFSQEDFNVFLYLDLQLATEEIASLTQRLEKKNQARQSKKEKAEQALEKLDTELQKTAKALKEKRKDAALTEKHTKLLERQKMLKKILIANQHPIDINAEIAARPAMGTITLRTNQTKLSAQELYLIYKQREAIEDFFKTYTDTLGNEGSYMRNEQTMEAWLFLNHLSSMITMEALNMIAQRPMKGTLSWNDMRKTLSTIRATKSNDEWYSAPIDPEVLRICHRLEIDPYRLDLLTTT